MGRGAPGASGPAHPGLCGARPLVCDPRVSMAVPAPADWTDTVPHRVSYDDHRVCRVGAAACARGRRAPSVSAGPAGRVEDLGDVRDRRHGARARLGGRSRAARVLRLGRGRSDEVSRVAAPSNRDLVSPGRRRHGRAHDAHVDPGDAPGADRSSGFQRGEGPPARDGRPSCRARPYIQQRLCRRARAAGARGPPWLGRSRSGWRLPPKRGS